MDALQHHVNNELFASVQRLLWRRVLPGLRVLWNIPPLWRLSQSSQRTVMVHGNVGRVRGGQAETQAQVDDRPFDALHRVQPNRGRGCVVLARTVLQRANSFPGGQPMNCDAWTARHKHCQGDVGQTAIDVTSAQYLCECVPGQRAQSTPKDFRRVDFLECERQHYARPTKTTAATRRRRTKRKTKTMKTMKMRDADDAYGLVSSSEEVAGERIGSA